MESRIEPLPISGAWKGSPTIFVDDRGSPHELFHGGQFNAATDIDLAVRGPVRHHQPGSRSPSWRIGSVNWTRSRNGTPSCIAAHRTRRRSGPRRQWTAASGRLQRRLC